MNVLQDVDAFDKPKVELEQYPTSVELAARMLYTVSSAHPQEAWLCAIFLT